MFQPFELLKPEYIDRLIRMDKIYLVSQSYDKAFDVKSIDDLKKRLDLKYKDNMRRYLIKNTTWRIDASEAIRPSMQVIYGELFIILKRGNQTLRVKSEDIEKA